MDSSETAVNVALDFRDELLAKNWPDDSEVARLAGLSADADAGEFGARARAGRILLGIWSAPRRAFVYPAFQFDQSGKPRPEVVELLALLPMGGDQGGWRCAFWLYSPHVYLDDRLPAGVFPSDPVCVLNVALLAELCDEAIDSLYTCSSQSKAVWLYGRDPADQPLIDILSAWLTQDDDRPAEDLLDELNARWSDDGDGRYGEDPWFVRSGSEWMLSAEWRAMARSHREEARFVNPAVAQTLEKVFGRLLEDRTSEGGKVIFRVGPGESMDLFYRARVFQSQGALENALSHPERELGPPSAGKGFAGRMNPQGVSVFYGATEPTTAIREVRPSVGSDVVVAAFRVTRPLRLLDLSKLESVEIDPRLSVFDPVTVQQVNRSQFLRVLESEMTKPVMPDFTEDGYLITQAIADFLSTHPRLDLDGIYFRSVQSPRGKEESRAHNVVLFHKASRVRFTGEGEEKAVSGSSRPS